MKRFLNITPLIAFGILIIVLYSFLTRENEGLESVLIDKSVPEFQLPELENQENLISKRNISNLPALIFLGFDLAYSFEIVFKQIFDGF